MNRSLRFETLEKKQMLTSLLVNFSAGPNFGNGGVVAPVVAGDFAAADGSVEAAAPVNTVGGAGGAGLVGTDGVSFDVGVSSDPGGGIFTTNTGTFVDQPILDSYLFANGFNTRTVTVSSLEEIADGSQVTVTVHGVGDQPNQDTLFGVSHNGALVGPTATTDFDSGDLSDTFVTFTFTKVAGVDSFAILFSNANPGTSGGLGGFSVTATPPNTPLTGDPAGVRVNVGGGQVTGSDGNVFLADAFFTGDGNNLFEVANNILVPGDPGNLDDPIFQSERFGTNLNFEIPLGPDPQTVTARLLFSELFFTTAGQRIFDVELEGELVLDDFDIFAAQEADGLQGNFSARFEEFQVVVTDGALSINLESLGGDGVNNAQIVGFEIIPVATSGLSITPSDGGTAVVEGGATDTVDFALTTAPTSDVTVTLSTGPQVTADVTTLTFTPENFDVPQTVTLAAVDDDESEDTQTVQVTATLASADPDFDGVPVAPLNVQVFDNDTVAIDFDQRTLFGGLTQPTSLVFGPDGRLYVASLSGVITVLTLDADNNVTDTQIINTVADQGEPNSITGLAFDPTEVVAPGQTPTLYVARSVINGNQGSPDTPNPDFLGRISALSGPNFDVIEDVVTGLPVSGFDHGINALSFDNNGDLLFTVGANSNTGVADGLFNSNVPESPLSAALIRARISDPNFNGDIQYEFVDPTDPAIPFPGNPNDQRNGQFLRLAEPPAGQIGVEVFATGLRNSFDFVVTTDGLIFATDNGPNGDPNDVTAPDELNLIVEGGFFGFPNLSRAQFDPQQSLENAEFGFQPGIENDGPIPGVPSAIDPLVTVASSTNGIDEFRSEVFNGQLRGQLFAQNFAFSGSDDVFFFERSEDGLDIVDVEVNDQISNDGLDIIAGPGGAIFSTSFSFAPGQGAITVAEPVDPTVTGPSPFDIFPFRAPAVGGNQFTIGGVNFGSLADTTVLIGGVEAQITSVEDTRIIGVFPSIGGTDGLLDVTVTTDGVTTVLEGAFLPVGIEAPALGDFNGDTVVDNADFDVFVNTFGSETDLSADANNDNVVNLPDFALFRDNVTPTPPSDAVTSQAVAIADEVADVSMTFTSSTTGLEGFSAAALATRSVSTTTASLPSQAPSSTTTTASEATDQVFLLAGVEEVSDEISLLNDDSSAAESSAIDEAFANELDTQLEVDLVLL